MSRRRKGDPVHGVVLLNKPAGLSSNQALQQVRRLFNARKAGHTGTLDPFATGMLPVCLGEATKTSAFLLDAVKAYRAELHFGVETDTGDLDGQPIQESALPDCDDAALERVLDTFRGEIQQVPPMYSALKRDGKPLYQLARQGIEVEREPRQVNILGLEVLEWSGPRMVIDVECSKGTYIRTLAADIARALGSCAHLKALHRRWVAPFSEQALVDMSSLNASAQQGNLAQHLLPVDAALPDWPVVVLGPQDMARFGQGNPVGDLAMQPGLVRVHSESGQVLGLGQVRNQRLHPKRVFQLD